MRLLISRGGRGIAAAMAVSVVVALGGCGSDEATPAAVGPPASQSAAPAVARVKPVEVYIPKIEARSSLLATAVNPDGSLAVPSVRQPMQAAWYRLGPVPGEPGPAIVLGHVDGERKPGIFFRLHELGTGDEIIVTKSDGTKVKFVAVRKEQVPKDKFPHDAVYGETGEPELRLITCGGVFDHAAHSYQDNVIIYAKLAP